jgi:hypothetical protein
MIQQKDFADWSRFATQNAALMKYGKMGKVVTVARKVFLVDKTVVSNPVTLFALDSKQQEAQYSITQPISLGVQKRG